MKLSEVKEILSADVLCGEGKMETEVKAACGCDLMSDVFGICKRPGTFAHRSYQRTGCPHGGNDGYESHCFCQREGAVFGNFRTCRRCRHRSTVHSAAYVLGVRNVVFKRIV